MSDAQSYRELELELQTILERIEHGSYEDLEDLLKDHDAGSKIVADLQKRLDKAKTKITKVSPKPQEQ